MSQQQKHPGLLVTLAVVLARVWRLRLTSRLPTPTGEPLPITAGAFPHEVFDAIVKKHVNDQGLVDYKALKADRNDLERYIIAVSATSPHKDPANFPSPEEKLSFWINAYNATVLYAITERPAMKSVNDEQANFFYFTKHKIGGEELSLYALENDVVRKEFKEPRIHFALNCASAGCPLLPNEAFMPARLEEQLAREAKRFCTNNDKVRISGKVAEVSQIFEWYKDDFVADGGPVKFCKKWGREDLADDAEVKFIPYDWAMNRQPGRGLFE